MALNALEDVTCSPKRLETLQRTGLLDTGPEEVFDRLSVLAAEILQCPITLVTLVDKDRQYFKSAYGLPEPWLSKRETAMSHSFCQHVLSNEPLVLSDAREHPILKDNLAIRDLKVVAYLGIPLTTSEGYTLGSFCAIDSKPRQWTEHDIRIMKGLASAALSEIELRLKNSDLIKAQHALADSNAELEERIQERTEFLNTVLDSMEDGLLVCDSQGTFTLANRAVREAWGISETLADLKNWPEHFLLLEADGKTSLPLEKAPIYRILRGEKVDQQELTVVPKGKLPRFISVTARALLDSNGKGLGAVLTVHDITERRQAEEERLRLISEQSARKEAIEAQRKIQSILENITDAFFSVDCQWNFTYINQAGQREMGEISTDLIGKNIWEVLPHVWHDYFYERFSKALFTGRRFDFEQYYEPRSVWWEFHVYPSKDGISVFYRNITERKIAEQERLRLLKREQDAFEAEMAAKTLEADKVVREQFIATLSHDLRNPLTAARHSAELILKKAENAELREKLAKMILHNVDRADSMIRDLLDLSRIQAKQPLPVKASACNLNDVINTCLEELTLIYGNRFVFDSTKSLDGYWSCDALRRIIENLTINGIKYGNPDSVVRIGAEGSGDKVILSVNNQGPIIPLEQQARLFEPFERATSSQETEKKGWGLGLTIVRGFVESHGGCIQVSSDPEHGTTFTVILPMDSRPYMTSAHSSSP
jgi:PAS domain S-box-containing protein